jgi:hypothetical protein
LGFVPDHDGPRSNLPPGHQSPDNVGVDPSEFFNDGAIRGAEYEKRPVSRIGQSAGQKEVAAALRLSRKAKVFFSKLGPTRQIVINQVIEERIVIHGIGSNYPLSQSPD